MARGIRIALTFVVLASAGCGTGTPELAPAEAEADHRSGILGEVGEMLVLARADRGGKPPSKLADLARYETGFPSGYGRLESGDVLLLWDAPLEEGTADKILAYEKAAPESGGYVLMQDGTTVKSLTAEEFQAASKAPGRLAEPAKAKAGQKKAG